MQKSRKIICTAADIGRASMGQTEAVRQTSVPHSQACTERAEVSTEHPPSARPWARGTASRSPSQLQGVYDLVEEGEPRAKEEWPI